MSFAVSAKNISRKNNEKALQTSNAFKILARNILICYNKNGGGKMKGKIFKYLALFCLLGCLTAGSVACDFNLQGGGGQSNSQSSLDTDTDTNEDEEDKDETDDTDENTETDEETDDTDENTETDDTDDADEKTDTEETTDTEEEEKGD